MNEEMKSLRKNTTWEVVDLFVEKTLLDIDGFLHKNAKLMVILRDLNSTYS